MTSIYEDFNWTTYINDYSNKKNTNITKYFDCIYGYAEKNDFFSYLLTNCRDPYNVNPGSILLLISNLLGKSSTYINTVGMYDYLYSTNSLASLEPLPKKDLIFYGDVVSQDLIFYSGAVNPPRFSSEENQHLLTFFLKTHISKSYLKCFNNVKDIGDYLDLIILILQKLLYEDASQSYTTFTSLSYHKNNHITASSFETEAMLKNSNQLLDIVRDIMGNPVKHSSNLFNSWENILSGIG